VLEDFGPTLASEHLASDDGLQVQDRLVKLRLAGIANYEQANFYCGMTVSPPRQVSPPRVDKLPLEQADSPVMRRTSRNSGRGFT
jgi:hypothetical protein